MDSGFQIFHIVYAKKKRFLRAEGPNKILGRFFWGVGVPPGGRGVTPMVLLGVGVPLSLRKVPPNCTPPWCHKKRCGPLVFGPGRKSPLLALQVSERSSFEFL